MNRFNQGSVISSNVNVGRAGKGQTAETRMDRASVRPPNLVQPIGRHTRGRGRIYARTRTRAGMYSFRLDKVRRLDGSSIDAVSSRPTLIFRGGTNGH